MKTGETCSRAAHDKNLFLISFNEALAVVEQPCFQKMRKFQKNRPFPRISDNKAKKRNRKHNWHLVTYTSIWADLSFFLCVFLVSWASILCAVQETSGGRQLLGVQFYTAFVVEPAHCSSTQCLSGSIQQTTESVDVA